MLELNLASNVRLEYLAEGAANVLYKICPRPPSPGSTRDSEDTESYEDYLPTEIYAPAMHPSFEGKLLRLRKANAFATSIAESHRHWVHDLAPLFPPQDIVEQALVPVRKDLLDRLNDDLRRAEDARTRPEKRRGVFLAVTEQLGLLVADMSCTSVEDEPYLCIEFKPKWLAQSPNAPFRARRCRTCALRARRSQEKVEGDQRKPSGVPGYCPLDLVSAEVETVRQVVERLLAAQRPEIGSQSKIASRLAGFLHKNQTLQRLRSLQTSLDPDGVLQTAPSSSSFLTAMTLRDCTLFLKVSK